MKKKILLISGYFFQNSSLPRCHLDTENFDSSIFQSLYEKAFAKNWNSLSPLLLHCRFFGTPFINDHDEDIDPDTASFLSTSINFTKRYVRKEGQMEGWTEGQIQEWTDKQS